MPDPTPEKTPGPEPGAERRPEPPRPPGRDRLRAALLRPSRAQVGVGVLLALMGFAAVVQVRVTEVEDSFAGYREQDLIDVLTGLSGTTQRAEAEITRLVETRDELRSASDRRRAALEQAEQESATLSILAGLVPVTGPGVRITITEEDDAVRAATMVDMVQELRTAGAEAMQVNGEVRLVAQSAIEDDEGGLLVDGRLVEAPYVVDVIGDPDNLANALTFLLGPRDNVERDGGRMEIDKRSSIDIEAVREPVDPEFAEPDQDQ